MITGGPGSGKSSLISALAALGHAHTEEAGRAIIREQQATGGHALPWSDRLAFAEAMLEHDRREHARASALAGPVFCDRGIPDIIGYLRLEGFAVPGHIVEAARQLRYNRTVFIAPHWSEIFVNDAERKQMPDEARRTFEAMAAVYPACGYDVIELPRAPISERANFVLERCGL